MASARPLWSRLARLPRWVKGVLAGVPAAIVYGIVGNRSDDGFLWLWALLGKSIALTVPLFIWIIGGVIVALGVVYLLRLFFSPSQVEKINSLESELSIMRQLVELDDSLLRLLPRIAPLQDREAAMRKVLGEFLRDCTRVFAGEVSRATILRAEGDYLLPWVSYQMSQESVGRTRFYIGTADPVQRRGVAGVAFLSLQLRVVHFAQVNGRWQADHRDYLDFDPERPFPPYRSFVALPIIGTTSTPIGVLCFDSMDSLIFDPPGIQELLAAISQKIAAAILIYQQLERNHADGGVEH